jgi:hypothetical protein
LVARARPGAMTAGSRRVVAEPELSLFSG